MRHIEQLLPLVREEHILANQLVSSNDFNACANAESVLMMQQSWLDLIRVDLAIARAFNRLRGKRSVVSEFILLTRALSDSGRAHSNLGKCLVDANSPNDHL